MAESRGECELMDSEMYFSDLFMPFIERKWKGYPSVTVSLCLWDCFVFDERLAIPYQSKWNGEIFGIRIYVDESINGSSWHFGVPSGQ